MIRGIDTKLNTGPDTTKFTLVWLLVFVLWWTGCVFSGSLNVYAKTTSVPPSSTLEIYARYYGTESVHMKTYSVSDLNSLGATDQLFSWIDNAPAVVIQSVTGVPLERIISDSKIDVNSVQSFDFYATDNPKFPWHFEGTNTPATLFQSKRYFFPNLYEAWDDENHKAGLGAENDPVKVTTVISLKESWTRSKNPDLENMDSTNGFRICFGMINVKERNASSATHSLYKIVVNMVGPPPEETGDNDDDTEKGADKGNKDKGNGSGNSKGGGKSDKGAVKKKKEGKGKGKGGGVGDGDYGRGGNVSNAKGIGTESSSVKISSGDGKNLNGKELTAAGKSAIAKLKGEPGGNTDGVNPYKIYEVSQESEPLKLPPLDNSMIPVLSSVLGIIFAWGGTYQYLFRIKGLRFFARFRK